MDVPYKGYTITPKSERQPDGRWLPVAELETSYRGVVTPQPPLRATPRETRAVRSDADTAAIKMAKAWIDANERKGTATRESAPSVNDPERSTAVDLRSKVPIESGTASPRRPKEIPAQDARPNVASLASVVSDKRNPAPPDKLNWAALYQAVGLDSDEKVERLTRVLVLHSLLDRLITAVLATTLASRRDAKKASNTGKALSDIAPLAIGTRVDLATIVGVAAPGVAESIMEVNRLRNTLVHFKSVPGTVGWNVSEAEEIASHDAYEQCMRKGFEAVQALMSALQRNAKEG